MIGKTANDEDDDEIDEAEVDEDINDSEEEDSDNDDNDAIAGNADGDSSDESVVSLNDKVQEIIEIPKKKNQFHKKVEMKQKNKSSPSTSSKTKKIGNKNNRKASWADI